MSKGSVMAGKAFVELSMKDKSKKGFNKAAMRMKKLKTLSLNVANPAWPLFSGKPSVCDSN